MDHVDTHYKFDRVAMDLLDVTNPSEKQNKYIFVVADYFTRYCEAYAIPDKKALTVADMFMEQWVLRYGFPGVVHSDQGKEFDNKLFARMTELGGILKTRTTPYHPQSDGHVERFNRTIIGMLAMFVNAERTNWDDLLPYLMLAYNTSVQCSTGFTPYRLVFGEECNLPADLVFKDHRPDRPPSDIGDYAEWVRTALEIAYDTVRERLPQAAARQKKYYDQRVVGRKFPIGMWVLRYWPPAAQNKLGLPWKGPFKVVRAPSGWTVGIQESATSRILYIHIEQLKQCAAPEPEPSWPITPAGKSLFASSAPPYSINRTSTQRDHSANTVNSTAGGDPHPATAELLNMPFQVKPSHVLSRLYPRSLEFRGFRFTCAEHLYLAFVVLHCGGETFLTRLAKTSSAARATVLVEKWMVQFAEDKVYTWHGNMPRVWNEIVSASAITDPLFRQTLRDSHPTLLCDTGEFAVNNPSGTLYATALMRLRNHLTRGDSPVTPDWLTSARRSHRIANRVR